ncbi:MAG TPA: menaquinone biosynthesis decarboxylase [candidate division Zixibacteria bacterium]|nr:menaquinone biosynthesis decarboxylase [candidate division Zixibacteria bacterium]
MTPRKPYNLDTLAGFIAALEAEGELLRISEEVSPILEISELSDRHSKMKSADGAYGGKALLFENVAGSDFPALINSLGSFKRMNIAFGGREFDEIADDITELIRPRKYMSKLEKLKELPALARVAGYLPKVVSSGACQEIVKTGEEIDLYKLGVIQCWPKDGGRFITMPQVFTKNPSTGVQNCGMYRLQVYDKNTTGMHIHMHHDGAFNARKYLAENGRVEIACAIGGDPACAYAATAPMPPGMDEMLIAGFIRKKAVRMVKCKTVDLHVPAEADIVIEGYVDINESRLEGPFGDHTGVYSLADQFPVFHVTAITHRRNAVYQTIIVGAPPQEDYYLGKATERLFLPLLQTQMPELVDMNMPLFGNFHNFIFLRIKKDYPLHARKVMHQVWGTGQMMFSKYVVVTDDVDVQDTPAVMKRWVESAHPDSDVEIVKGPVDILDHSGEATGIGYKMGIDLTEKWNSEGRAAISRSSATPSGAGLSLTGLQKNLPCLKAVNIPDFKGNRDVIFAQIDKQEPGDAQRVIEALWQAGKQRYPRYVVVVDTDTDIRNVDQVMFRWGNNVDPFYHMVILGDTSDEETDSEGAEHFCVGIDATRHWPEEGYDREWPEDIVMDEAVKRRVAERFGAYL